MESRAQQGAAPSTRAAIYTRVSTDENLAMEFNSLEAQREACETYITSQRHEAGSWFQSATMTVATRGAHSNGPHATKGPRRFRYYVATEGEPATGRKTRVPASSIEAVIITRVTAFLRDGHAIDRLTGGSGRNAVTLDGLLHGASAAAADLEGGTSARKRELLLLLVRQITLAENEVTISLKASASIAMANLPMPADGLAEITLSGSYQVVRRSREVRLALAPCSQEPAPDPTLVKLIVKAHAARQALFAVDGGSLAEVAKIKGHEPGYFAVLVKLAYLAPDIIDTILADRQPRRLDRQTLARIRQLPIEWDAQRGMLGFAG